MAEVIQKNGAGVQARPPRPTAPAADVPPQEPAKQAVLERR
ncbi:hypothetical protein [Streptomyces avermitilis]|nr:hypothetical protein [Streptomyces avermitilis]